MRQAVYKYEIPINGSPLDWHPVTMHAGANVVRVGSQNDKVFVWALVDPGWPAEMEHFRAVPTGLTMDDPGLYLGTTEILDDTIVVHVFQRLPKIPPPPAYMAAVSEEQS